MKTPLWGTKTGERFFSALRFQKDRSYHSAWHQNAGYELFLVVRGRGSILIGDYAGHFRPGEAYFIGPYLPHGMFSPAQAPPMAFDVYVLHIRPEVLDTHLPPFPELAGLLPVTQACHRGIRIEGKVVSVLRDKLAAMCESEGTQAFITMLEVMEILAARGDANQLSSPNFLIPRSRKEERRVDAICRHINEHSTEPLRLPDIAEHMGMSVSALNRLFKRSTGRSMGQYINEIRVDHVCHMLAETDHTIVEIALDAGYNTLSNFNRMFRRIKGQTPREFRAEFQDVE